MEFTPWQVCWCHSHWRFVQLMYISSPYFACTNNISYLLNVYVWPVSVSYYKVLEKTRCKVYVRNEGHLQHKRSFAYGCNIVFCLVKKMNCKARHSCQRKRPGFEALLIIALNADKHRHPFNPRQVSKKVLDYPKTNTILMAWGSGLEILF